MADDQTTENTTPSSGSVVADKAADGLAKAYKGIIALDKDGDKIVERSELQQTTGELIAPLKSVPFREQIIAEIKGEIGCDALETMSPEIKLKSEKAADAAITTALGMMKDPPSESSIKMLGQMFLDSKTQDQTPGSLGEFIAQERPLIEYTLDRSAKAINHPRLQELREQLPSSVQGMSLEPVCAALDDAIATPISHNLGVPRGKTEVGSI